MPPFEHEYPQLGETLDGKYHLQRIIGEGAMGAVIQATHLLRQAPVALKFMSPAIIDTPGVVERFLNEGVAASRIDNEHVVGVLDVSKLPSGVPYLVMEYLDGEDLERLLSREAEHGLPDVARAVHVVLQVLRALQVAHRVGIVHRDLKPANCFVIHKDGEPDFIKILDFGISKVEPVARPSATEGSQKSPLNLTQAGATLGTPLYVSPEQARDPKNVDARSDLYSVAAMLYEMLCGHAPFDPESGLLSELFMLLASADPRPLDERRSDLPAGLSEAVARGLVKDPDDRYQSSFEMAAALAPFADERSELVVRQLLQRPSARADVAGASTRPPLPGADAGTPMPRAGGGTAVVVGSGSAPGALAIGSTPSPSGSLPVRGSLPPSARGETQRGWISSAPPASSPRSAPTSAPAGTAPGVGVSNGGAPAGRRSLGLAALAALGLVGGVLGVLALRSSDAADAAGDGATSAAAASVGAPDDPASEPGSRARAPGPTSAASTAIGLPAAEQLAAADAGAVAVAAPASSREPRSDHPAKNHAAKGPPRHEQTKRATTPSNTGQGTPGGRLRLRDIGRDRGRP